MSTGKSKAGLTVAVLGVFVIIFSFFAGMTGSYIGSRMFSQTRNSTGTVVNPLEVIEEESAIIDVAESASPSVVSIIVTKDLPVYEDFIFNPFGDSSFRIPSRQQSGTEEQQVGAGTGFVISSDGMIITNKHVVEDTDAQYSVVFSDSSTYDAEVIARDTVVDIAVLSITPDQELTPLPIGDSDSLSIGQTVIAIGNSLGEFSNTVSAGIVSGLSRDIVASDGNGGGTSQINGVIQTDASINVGNSGGPLLDVSGNVIGVNVAVAESAENIGFSIPINSVKRIIDSVNEFGEIVRPYLGVRYIPVTPQLQEENDLAVDFGAMIVLGGEGEPGIVNNSPADKAGLKVNDIITEVGGVMITEENTLQSEIQKYNVGDEITLKYVRGEEGKETTVLLERQP